MDVSPNAPKIIDGALRCATTHPTSVGGLVNKMRNPVVQNCKD